MKKLLFLFLLCYSVGFAAPMQNHTIDPAALTELASRLGIPPGTDIIAETQKQWLRKSGSERWEMAELPADQKQFVLDWAAKQGLFSPWKSVSKEYDTALILGATTYAMKVRLNYLAELWKQGVRFKEIVWLCGDRPLDKRVDGLTERCSNESEAAHILWNEADLPKEMRALPVTFIALPMKKSGRPTTEDTLIAWLQASPSPCRALFLSSQPFCGYQFAVVESKLPDSFSFDLVGPGCDPTSHPSAAAITLDSIARWIYQDSKNG